MEIVTLTEVKSQLSRFIDRVRRGGRVRILSRGVPVADLVPVEGDGETGDGESHRLLELERRGWLRRGRATVPDDLLTPGPSASGAPTSEIVISERRSGR